MLALCVQLSMSEVITGHHAFSLRNLKRMKMLCTLYVRLLMLTHSDVICVATQRIVARRFVHAPGFIYGLLAFACHQFQRRPRCPHLFAVSERFHLLAQCHDFSLFLLEMALRIQIIHHGRYKPRMIVAPFQLTGIGGKKINRPLYISP